MLLNDQLSKKLDSIKKNIIDTLPEDPLPNWGEGMSAIMNALARSSTFSPVEKGERNVIGSRLPVKISSQNGYDITFSGPQLDEADRDVYLQITKIYSGITPGLSCKISVRDFLKGIKRNVGTSDRTWLIESLKRLAEVRLNIKASAARFDTGTIGILNFRARDENENGENNGLISFSIPSEFIGYFLKEYTKIPLDKRLALKGSGSQLAKWLHSYIYSHSTPFPIKVKTLKELSDSKISNINIFRYSLKKALELLKNNNDIVDWKIEKGNDLVFIYRKKEDVYQQYLQLGIQ